MLSTDRTEILSPNSHQGLVGTLPTLHWGLPQVERCRSMYQDSECQVIVCLQS